MFWWKEELSIFKRIGESFKEEAFVVDFKK